MCSAITTQPTYTSDGLLLDRVQKSLLQAGAPPLKDTHIFYFAGRAVAQLDATPSASAVTYVSVDHLGAPLLASSANAVVSWSGDFEPFGRDWSGAQAAGEFLRFPGQWEDQSWSTGSGPDFSYNLNRWYDAATGRYSRPDPMERISGTDQQRVPLIGHDFSYAYARQNPVHL